MAKGEQVGFRLHPVKDRDIIEDAAKYKNATERWKEVYRKVLAFEAASLAALQAQSSGIPASEVTPVTQTTIETPPTYRETNVVHEPTVHAPIAQTPPAKVAHSPIVSKPLRPGEAETIKNTILDTDF